MTAWPTISREQALTQTLPACWTATRAEQPFQLAAARPRALPTFAQQYDGASTGSVVLVSGDNSDVPSYNDMYEMDLESYYHRQANYSFRPKTP